jgi:hypothetical protein
LAELRAEEAFDYLRNVNSGHPGSITSIHAASADLAFEQLVLLVKQNQGGRELAREDIKSLLYLLIDVVIQFGVESHERFIKEIWYDPERKRRVVGNGGRMLGDIARCTAGPGVASRTRAVQVPMVAGLVRGARRGIKYLILAARGRSLSPRWWGRDERSAPLLSPGHRTRPRRPLSICARLSSMSTLFGYSGGRVLAEDSAENRAHQRGAIVAERPAGVAGRRAARTSSSHHLGRARGSRARTRPSISS